MADYFEQTGKSKRSLARRLNIHESYLSHIVARRKQPSLALALAIADATGVPVSSLVREVAA